MTFPNLASSARGLRGWQHLLAVTLIIAVSVVVGLGSVSLLQDDTHVFAWWPAAGVNVIAAVAARRRYRWMVLVVIVVCTIPVSVIVGRPLIIAVVTALAVGAEAYIVTRFAVDADDQPRLTTTADVLRFFVGVLIGATLAGTVSGVALAVGFGVDPVHAGFSVFASHASAIAVIAPIALVSRLKHGQGRLSVRVVHAVLLIASIGVAFTPGGPSSLSFLPVPFLAWAAFSFSMWFSLVELIGASALIVALTALGGGPFIDRTTGWLTPASLLELYVATLSVTILLIASARNERQQLVDRNSASAVLLHEGFQLSRNGFAVVQKDGAVYRVLEANPAARDLLGHNLSGDRVADGSWLLDLIEGSLHYASDHVTVSSDTAGTAPIEVTVTVAANATFGDILLLSIVDLRAVRAAEEAGRLQLEREQRVVEELRALGEQKDGFVSSITHELRTPITTIIGFTEELADTDLDPVQKNYVAIVLRNAERLLRTIEDVLTFTRRLPGTEVSHATELDVTHVVRAVLDDVHHSVRDRDLLVTLDAPDEPVLTLADANDLTRVIVNLLTNAIKFTPVGGTIAVTVSSGDGEAQVTITDSGPGIAPDELERVFDRFYRSSGATRDEVPGTGLGLAIVRDLVGDMHGTVVLESDGVSGTTARVVLPLAVRVG